MIRMKRMVGRLAHLPSIHRTLSHDYQRRSYLLSFHRALCTKAPPPVRMSDRELVYQLLHHQRLWWWVGGTVLAGVTLVAFGPELKVGVSKHTADVATKSLQDETLQSHTRELASQIVQTVLNDPKVLEQASQFIQRLVAMPTTRDAIRNLIVQALNDPVTLSQVARLAKQTLATLMDDPKTLQQVVELLRSTVLDPQAKDSLLLLLEALLKDEQTRRNLTQLVAYTMAQDAVKTSVSNTMADSVHDVLSRTDVQNHAKEFVGSVVRDQTVQAQSGDAIWSTLIYALTPTWLSWLWGSSGSDATAPLPIDADVVLKQQQKEEVAHLVPAPVRALAEPSNSSAETKQPEPVTLKRTKTTTRQATIRKHPTTKQHEKEASAPSEAKNDPKKHSAEEYDDRHWHGTGSGFL